MPKINLDIKNTYRFSEEEFCDHFGIDYNVYKNTYVLVEENGEEFDSEETDDRVDYFLKDKDIKYSFTIDYSKWGNFIHLIEYN